MFSIGAEVLSPVLSVWFIGEYFIKRCGVTRRLKMGAGDRGWPSRAGAVRVRPATGRCRFISAFPGTGRRMCRYCTHGRRGCQTSLILTILPRLNKLWQGRLPILRACQTFFHFYLRL